MRKRHTITVRGVAMLAVTLLPFPAYFSYTQDGSLIWTKVRATIAPPHLPELDPDDRAWARANSPSYTDAVALLAYHGVGDTGAFSLSAGRFGEHLATLQEAGFRTVTATDVALARAGLKPLPRNAVMISFDDGRADAMLLADPLLRAARMRASMFVISGAASEPGIYYVGWDDLRRYARGGVWDLQSHSASGHALLDEERPLLTNPKPDEDAEAFARRVRRDLDGASRAISKRTGARPVAFAYPFGAHGAADDARTGGPFVRDALADAVRRTSAVAFHQDDQTNWTLDTCGGDALGLRRLEVGDWSGRELLTRIASGVARTDMGSHCGTRAASGEAAAWLASLPMPVRERLEGVAPQRRPVPTPVPLPEPVFVAPAFPEVAPAPGRGSRPRVAVPVAGVAQAPAFEPVSSPRRRSVPQPTPAPFATVPTAEPQPAPGTPRPTAEPAPVASVAPTPRPTAAPTPRPTVAPTPRPTVDPTPQPAVTPAPRGRGPDGNGPPGRR